MSNYAAADTRAQWFADRYPGSAFTPNCAVLHTTEGTSWPDYDGGAKAPNYTAKPDGVAKRLRWRAHFSDEESSRALRNEAGGVETNTLNAVQVELVGTCAPATRDAWRKKGLRQDVDFVFWPEAPDWAIRDLAAFVADMHERHGIRIEGPDTWLAYPASYGKTNPNRFTFAEWRAFYGWCGHQHVPENDHGDPGALPWAKIRAAAKSLVSQPVAFSVLTANWDQFNTRDDDVSDGALIERRRPTVVLSVEAKDRRLAKMLPTYVVHQAAPSDAPRANSAVAWDPKRARLVSKGYELLFKAGTADLLDRYIAYADLEIDGQTLRYGAIHTPPGRDQAALWATTMDAARTFIKGSPYPVVLGGDWNRPLDSGRIRLGKNVMLYGHGIDGFAVPKSFACVNLRPLTRTKSDHDFVLATFTTSPGGTS